MHIHTYMYTVTNELALLALIFLRDGGRPLCDKFSYQCAALCNDGSSDSLKSPQTMDVGIVCHDHPRPWPSAAGATGAHARFTAGYCTCWARSASTVMESAYCLTTHHYTMTVQNKTCYMSGCLCACARATTQQAALGEREGGLGS